MVLVMAQSLVLMVWEGKENSQKLQMEREREL